MHVIISICLVNQFSSVQLLSYVQLFATPWIAACQASLSISNSWTLLKLMSIQSPSVAPFSSHPQFSPETESFSISQLFTLSGQSIGTSTSTSVLQMSIQAWYIRIDWSPCCPRDSQEFSWESQFKSISYSAFILLYGPTVTSIHDCWKNHRFEYMGLYQQNDVSVICCLCLS